jgi:hypothetical protein
MGGRSLDLGHRHPGSEVMSARVVVGCVRRVPDQRTKPLHEEPTNATREIVVGFLEENACDAHGLGVVREVPRFVDSEEPLPHPVRC